MPESNIDKLNKELSTMGVETIVSEKCPWRKLYLDWYNMPMAERPDDWGKRLKYRKEQYLLTVHHYIAEKYPYLLYESNDDKTFWLYNEATGVYDELVFVEVRSLILKVLMDDHILDKATEAVAKQVIARYKSSYPERGHVYGNFDTDTEWFHCSNGWVHTKTLKFEPHTPERLSRRVSAVAYDKKAKCPIYDTFLDTQLQLKADQVRVLDQFSGYLLTPNIHEQKMLVLIGKPGCGKSTLLNCWSDILGDCATQKSLTKISADSFARFGGSSLVGRRLCWFDEVEVKRSNMGNDLINLITGQHIEVERKGIDGLVEVKNQLKCVLTANTLPRSAEMGIYRRMILIYLEYSFYDSMTADKKILDVLKKESSGILNRMLRGLADLNKHNGFTGIEGHDDLIEEYKTSSNTVAEFLDEYFIPDIEAKPIPTKVLLEAYKEFSNDRYSESLTPQRFGMVMKHHGLSRFDKIYVKKDRMGTKQWCGLRLREELYEFNQSGYIRAKEDQNF